MLTLGSRLNGLLCRSPMIYYNYYEAARVCKRVILRHFLKQLMLLFLLRGQPNPSNEVIIVTYSFQGLIFMSKPASGHCAQDLR